MTNKLTQRKLISDGLAEAYGPRIIPDRIHKILENFTQHDPDWTTLKIEVSRSTELATGAWDIYASVLYEEES